MFFKTNVDVMITKSIKWNARISGMLHFDSAAPKMLFLLLCAIPLSGCALALSKRVVHGTDDAVSVRYAAREWADHNDGRVYGGVVNSPGILSGILGTYRGCLVEVRSRTLIVLTGAMEFHQPDGHSVKQHVFSNSIFGDRPASIIMLGSTFTVAGLKTKSLPNYIRLDQNVPVECAQLPYFLTESETLKPN